MLTWFRFLFLLSLAEHLVLPVGAVQDVVALLVQPDAAAVVARELVFLALDGGGAGAGGGGGALALIDVFEAFLYNRLRTLLQYPIH